MYPFSADAADAAHIWLVSLASEQEVDWDKLLTAQSDVAHLLRDMLLSTLVEGHDLQPLGTDADDDTLEEWFERQMRE